MKYLLTSVIAFIILIIILRIYRINSKNILKNLRKIKDAKILKNYVINGKKIAYIMICEKGIFLVNVIKNHGDVFGSDYSKDYVISYHDKEKKIVSPTIYTRNYAISLYKVLHELDFNGCKVYQATIFPNADVRYLKSSFVFKNIKTLIGYIKNLNFNLTKKDVLQISKSLDNSREKNAIVIENEFSGVPIFETNKAYK